VETVPFDEWTLRDYNRSYGDKRDAERRLKDGEVYRDQKGMTDMIYCFCYAPTGEPLTAPRVRHPPSKAEMLSCEEGALERLYGVQKQKKVDELWELFLSYVKGIHIG